MKTLICMMTLGLLNALSAQAQEIDLDKYEVGIDILWIIQRNNIPMSFFIKKIDARPKTKGFGYVRRGYRLRIGGNYHRPNDETQTPSSLYFRKSSYSLLLRPGYEWHKKIKSFDVYYGGDLNMEISGQKNENIYVTLGDNGEGYNYSYYNQNYNTMNIGVAPVLGMSIKIINGLNITLESTANVSYIRNKNTYSDSIDNYEDIILEGKGFAFQLYPLYTLNASFTF